MDPRAAKAQETYFRTFNEKDDEAHVALYTEGAEYFGTATGVVASDRLTAQRALKAGRELLGIVRLEPLAFFGDWPRFAVRVKIHGNRGPGHEAEGVFVFVVDEAGTLRSVWALWNPAAFLTYGS